MIETNPFAMLSEIVPVIVMQGFILGMLALILLGTIVQMVHHKNITYFFNNAKKAKLQATREVGVAEKAKILTKTAVYDIGTTSELGFGKRRLAHVLGMYGTIIFWISSTLKKNQNQYPPTQVNIAPTCHIIDQIVEDDFSAPV